MVSSLSRAGPGGMLQLPTATSLPMGRILTVVRAQSPLLVGLNLVPVPLGRCTLGWGGFSPTGVPVWAPAPCGFGASPLKARLLKGEGIGQEGLAQIRQDWVGRRGSPPAPMPQRLFGQGGSGQTSRAGLSPALTSFSRDIQRPRMLFIIHTHIPRMQPHSSLFPGSSRRPASMSRENTRRHVTGR